MASTSSHQPSNPQGLGNTIAITWRKFLETVLPNATEIEVDVPYSGSFYGLVTAVDADSPPILQWDYPDRRNPVSWYTYVSGSPASQWGLKTGWTEIYGITMSPNLWDKERPQLNHGEKVFFLIRGMHNQGEAGDGKIRGGFFVESLRSEYHSAKRALEAYMRTMPVEVEDVLSDHACGLVLPHSGYSHTVTVRVTLGKVTQTYHIDRWS
jgi:hypothetical protein